MHSWLCFLRKLLTDNAVVPRSASVQKKRFQVLKLFGVKCVWRKKMFGVRDVRCDRCVVFKAFGVRCLV